MPTREATKTWVVTSPRSRHPRMHGETVPIFTKFSNGMDYPGDPSGSSDQTAGCSCTMSVDLPGGKLPLMEQSQGGPTVRQRWDVPDDMSDEAVEALEEIDTLGLRTKGWDTDGEIEFEAFEKLHGGFNGTYRRGSDHQRPKISMAKAGDSPRHTMAHEVGHHFDRHFHLSGSVMETTEWNRVRAAIEGSNATRKLKAKLVAEMGRTTPDPEIIRYCSYLLQPQEQWARAFAQYVSVNTQGARGEGMWRHELKKLQFVSKRWFIQWQDDDFDDIAGEMNRLFDHLRSKGLM